MLCFGVSAAAEGPQTYPGDKGPQTVDVSGYPKDIQKSYAPFKAKCGICHPLGRAINKDMTAREWKLYTKRMMKKAGDKLISPAEGKAIYKFLKFYQAEKDKKRAAKAQ